MDFTEQTICPLLVPAQRVALLPAGQERFSRAKTMRDVCTEEATAERFKGKVILETSKPERSGVPLLIDFENSIQAQQSSGREDWAKIETLKRGALTMVFLDRHNIPHFTDLEREITELQDSSEQTAAALKAAGIGEKLPDLVKLREEYSGLSEEKNRLYAEYGSLKKRMQEYDAIKQNIDSILSPSRGQEQDKGLQLL